MRRPIRSFSAAARLPIVADEAVALVESRFLENAAFTVGGPAGNELDSAMIGGSALQMRKGGRQFGGGHIVHGALLQADQPKNASVGKIGGYPWGVLEFCSGQKIRLATHINM